MSRVDGGKIEYNPLLYSVRVSRTSQGNVARESSNKASSTAFNEILREAVQKEQAVKFSKHAQIRMRQRNISLSQQEIDLIGQAIEKAKAKGVRDSLVLMGNLAFIVNVPTKTIVTAVDGESIKESVFTNIDGAVVL
ncbi:flagellar operon protein [Caldicoprobacter guelmensis]|uniref:TIGR02530 family flagellar biosynthesis protein n=1 Tax=Caldicoprobacter guelmensis TaxID=1170224 RepID=UPI00195E7FA0|nr:TIGR02530 family flagellar biosynthesis protein [Caldicoprobacter guelmensis]MBM7581384.1 flagellar operon protein [Caldicoprobacter guelmensis]